MKGLGFKFPRRWPTREEFTAHAIRMQDVRDRFGLLAPVTLGVPTILDQGDEGSCGGEAIVQGIHVNTGKPILSPAFPYWCARREDVSTDAEVTDSGIDPFSMVKAIADFGACPNEDDPYDTSKANEKPGAMAFSTAQQVRVKMTPILESGDALWPVIQHVICVERLPVFIAIDVMPAFDNVGPDGIIDNPGGTSRGGHANLLYGVTDIGGQDANSWGTSWGVDGTCILTPRYLSGACNFAASVEVLT